MARESAALSLRRRILLLFLYGIGTASYLIVGGTVMWRLERPGEVATKERQGEFIQSVVRRYRIAPNDTDELEGSGVCTFPDHKDPHWSYTGSVFFMLTVITTIGYGETAPKTWQGQLFCFFYSIPGISIAGLWLQNMAGLLADIITGIVQRIHQRIRRPPPLLPDPTDRATAYERYSDPATDLVNAKGLKLFLQDMTRQTIDPKVLSHVMRCVDTQHAGYLDREQAMTAISIWYQVSEELPNANHLKLGYVIACVASTLAWMASFAAVFSLTEGWTYAESLWFCYVTLSTIGFGDYIPAKKLSRSICFFFICGGLGMMGALLGIQTDVFVDRRFWCLHWLHNKGWISTKLMEAHGINITVPKEDESPQVKGEEDGEPAVEKDDDGAQAPDTGAPQLGVGELAPQPAADGSSEGDARWVYREQSAETRESAQVLPVVPLPLAMRLRAAGRKPPPPRSAPPPLPWREEIREVDGGLVGSPRRRKGPKPPPPLIPPPPPAPCGGPQRAAPAPAAEHAPSAASEAQVGALLDRLAELEAWRAEEEERRAARRRLDAALLERQVLGSRRPPPFPAPPDPTPPPPPQTLPAYMAALAASSGCGLPRDAGTADPDAEPFRDRGPQLLSIEQRSVQRRQRLTAAG